MTTAFLDASARHQLFGAAPCHVPKHVTRFAPATGLRQASVLALRQPDVDTERRTAWVHADDAKGRLGLLGLIRHRQLPHSRPCRRIYRIGHCRSER
jgi:integrase